MRKYLYQRFLPNCDTENMDLRSYLSSIEAKAQRLSLTELDEKVDTEEDLKKILCQFKSDVPIVLVDDRPLYENIILSEYAKKTFLSYVFWIKHFGFECYITTATN